MEHQQKRTSETFENTFFFFKVLDFMLTCFLFGPHDKGFMINNTAFINLGLWMEKSGFKLDFNHHILSAEQGGGMVTTVL